MDFQIGIEMRSVGAADAALRIGVIHGTGHVAGGCGQIGIDHSPAASQLTVQCRAIDKAALAFPFRRIKRTVGFLDYSSIDRCNCARQTPTEAPISQLVPLIT